MKFFIIFLYLLFPAVISKAQNTEDILLLNGVFSPVKPVEKYEFARGLNSNEYIWLLSKLFFVYKNNISSQDSGACNFAPSCSEFAMISVKELGPVRGILNGFDRLLRCHPGARGEYQIDKDNFLKLSDPLILLK